MTRIPSCPKCSRPGIHYPRHDSYGCNECGIWIENRCTDSLCRECHTRPAQPEGSVTRFRGVVVDST